MLALQRSRSLLLVTALALAACGTEVPVPATVTQDDDEDTATGSLSGRVEVEETLLPKSAPGFRPMAIIGLEGATVQAIREGEVIAETTTGAGGAWEIAGLEEGTYVIRAFLATDAGVFSITTDSVTVVAGNTLDLGKLTLELTGAIQGTVELDDKGDWSEILVFIPGTSFLSLTGSDGKFTLLYVPAGTWTIKATKEGYSSVTVENVTVTAGEATSLLDRIVLFPTGSISDADGDGIEDLLDNCPGVHNPEQEDFDLDNFGDACDLDDDNDLRADTVDAFPFDPLEWQDSDGDGVGNNGDNCPEAHNPAQDDLDDDGDGDACDADDDDDGYTDAAELLAGTDPKSGGSVLPAPDTTITSAPEEVTSDVTAVFTFTSDSPAWARFECSFDGEPWMTCVSGSSFGPFAPGEHTIRVRAVDTAGVADATPAAYSWWADTLWIRENRYTYAGDDEACETGDDVLGSYERSESDGQGRTVLEISYRGPGLDEQWFTADDERSRMHSYVYEGDERVREDNIEYPEYGPYPEESWDDYAGSRETWLSLADRERRVHYTSAGFDDLWGTADDVIGGYGEYWSDATSSHEALYDGRGQDVLWFTGDDSLYSRRSTYRHEDGRSWLELQYARVETDGVEVVQLVGHTIWYYDAQLRPVLQEVRSSAGPDDQWVTEDDVVHTRRFWEYDGTNGKLLVTFQSEGPGTDGEWGTEDDPVFMYERYAYNATGQVIAEEQFRLSTWCAGPCIGGDDLWGTEDDEIDSGTYTTYARSATGYAAFTYGGPGTDTVWKSADDVVTVLETGVREEYAGGFTESIVDYSDPGDDGLWGTDDDIVDEGRYVMVTEGSPGVLWNAGDDFFGLYAMAATVEAERVLIGMAFSNLSAYYELSLDRFDIWIGPPGSLDWGSGDFSMYGYYRFEPFTGTTAFTTWQERAVNGEVVMDPGPDGLWHTEDDVAGVIEEGGYAAPGYHVQTFCSP